MNQTLDLSYGRNRPPNRPGDPTPVKNNRQKGTLMNPETLLHMAAEELTAEAVKGPGTMFLLLQAGRPAVTRTPTKLNVKEIVGRYDCTKFCAGLSAKQWGVILLSLDAVRQEQEKGDADEQQPAKKP